MNKSIYAKQLDPTKQHSKMAVKIGWLIADFLGISVAFLGIIANLDNVKSLIIAILGAVYLGLRVFYYKKEKDQKIREKEYELWHKEQDKIEREEKIAKLRRSADPPTQ
jgi:hypothetical protein